MIITDMSKIFFRAAVGGFLASTYSELSSQSEHSTVSLFSRVRRTDMVYINCALAVSSVIATPEQPVSKETGTVA